MLYALIISYVFKECRRVLSSMRSVNLMQFRISRKLCELSLNETNYGLYYVASFNVVNTCYYNQDDEMLYVCRGKLVDSDKLLSAMSPASLFKFSPNKADFTTIKVYGFSL